MGLKRHIKYEKAIHDYIISKIRDHEKSMDIDNPRDYIDAFLIEKYRLENEITNGNKKEHYFTGTSNS